MSSFNLSFSASTFIIVLLVLLAVAVAVVFYRYTLPPVPLSKRILLVVLRSLALSLLLLFLCEPLLRVITTSTEKPVLAILIDDSKSMRIRDRTGDRAELLRTLLKSDDLKTIEEAGLLRYFTFGAKLSDGMAIDTDTLGLSEDATDISAALKSLSARKETENIGAALLLTDGSYNLGQNPLYEAEHLGLPLFSIGIGDSIEQKDLLVTKISANELVYAETEVPVDVTVKSSGFKGERVEVTLNDGARELHRQQLILDEGTREYSVRLSYMPGGEGMKKYTVRLSRLPNELTTANNQKSFFARVLKSKLRVLIIGGAPSPDLSIVKQTLKEDRNIAVDSRTLKDPTSFYEGDLTRRLLDSADCLVLIGFPPSSAPDQLLDLMRTTIARNVTPVLFINGKTVDQGKLSSLNAYLPFSASAPSTIEQFVFVEPVSSGHPVLATNTGLGTESWRRLPPIFKLQTQYKAKPEGTTIAFAKLNTFVLTEPLIVLRNVNRQKTLAVLGYGIWRWRLMAQGNANTETLLSTFLSNGIRWLTTRDDDRPVKVSPTKTAFTRGEPVEFAAQVYDASANPVDNAQLTVAVQSGKSEFETTLRSIGSGRYEGSLDGLEEGDYTFRARAATDGQSLGDDRGRFTVGELNLEYQDTRMNAQLLRQLAATSGGEFISSSETHMLREKLAAQTTFVPRQIQRAQSLELWNWKYMLAAVVLLLAVEWFIRKRSGML